MKMIAIAKNQHCVLVFDFPKNTLSNVNFTSCNNVNYDTLHKRLGHLSSPVYNLIASKNYLAIIDNIQHCSICPISKQNRLYFFVKNHFSVN